ncbi:MAG: hypothetical protein AAFP20_12915 [Cyanobacteria bacterium J06614_10]
MMEATECLKELALFGSVIRDDFTRNIGSWERVCLAVRQQAARSNLTLE